MYYYPSKYQIIRMFCVKRGKDTKWTAPKAESQPGTEKNDEKMHGGGGLKRIFPKMVYKYAAGKMTTNVPSVHKNSPKGQCYIICKEKGTMNMKKCLLAGHAGKKCPDCKTGEKCQACQEKAAQAGKDRVTCSVMGSTIAKDKVVATREYKSKNIIYTAKAASVNLIKIPGNTRINKMMLCTGSDIRHSPGVRPYSISGIEARVFGSRILGTHQRFSDIDIALKGKEKISLQVQAALKQALSESDLPILVDIVDWHAISDEFKSIIEKKFEIL